MSPYNCRHTHPLRIRLSVYLLSLLFAIGAPLASAQTGDRDSQELAGRVILVSGNVIARDSNGDRLLSRRAEIYVGDTIFTDTRASTQIRMVDDALISLQESTEFAIVAYEYEQEASTDESTIQLIQGGFRTITGKIGQQNRESYEARISNYATIGIRGTDFEVVITNEGVFTGVSDGGTTVSNGSGSIDLGIGANFDYAQIPTPNSPPAGLLSQPASLGVIPLAALADTDETGDEDNDTQTSEDTVASDGDNTQTDGDSDGDTGPNPEDTDDQTPAVQDIASTNFAARSNSDTQTNNDELDLQTPTEELSTQVIQTGTTSAIVNVEQEETTSNLAVSPNETSGDGSLACANASSNCLSFTPAQEADEPSTSEGEETPPEDGNTSNDDVEDDNSGNNGNGNSGNNGNGNSGNNGNGNSGNNGNGNSGNSGNGNSDNSGNGSSGNSGNGSSGNSGNGNSGNSGNGNSGNSGNGNSSNNENGNNSGNDVADEDSTGDDNTDSSDSDSSDNTTTVVNDDGSTTTTTVETDDDGNTITTTTTVETNDGGGASSGNSGNGNSNNNGNGNSGNGNSGNGNSGDDTTTTTTTTVVNTDGDTTITEIVINDDGSTTTTTIVTNDDGSTTTTSVTTPSGNGNSGNNGNGNSNNNGNGNSGNNGNGSSGNDTTTTTTVVNDDGSTTTTTIVTNDDGSTTTTRVTTPPASNSTSSSLQKPELTLDSHSIDWGRWNNQADENFVVVTRIDEELTLISTSDYLAQVNPTPIAKLTGSHNYATTIMSSFIGSGSAGDISNLRAGMSVDFDTGIIDQGTLDIQVAEQLWAIEFGGSIHDGVVDITASNGMLLDAGNIVSNSIDANLGGVFSGDTGSAFVGGFDLIDEMNAYNSVNGLFTIER
jgi:hypothetical protein